MSSGEWYFVEGVFNSESSIEHLLSYVSCQLSLSLLSALCVESLIGQERGILSKKGSSNLMSASLNHISIYLKRVDPLFDYLVC